MAVDTCLEAVVDIPSLVEAVGSCMDCSNCKDCPLAVAVAPLLFVDDVLLFLWLLS